MKTVALVLALGASCAYAGSCTFVAPAFTAAMCKTTGQNCSAEVAPYAAFCIDAYTECDANDICSVLPLASTVYGQTCSSSSGRRLESESLSEVEEHGARIKAKLHKVHRTLYEKLGGMFPEVPELTAAEAARIRDPNVFMGRSLREGALGDVTSDECSGSLGASLNCYGSGTKKCYGGGATLPGQSCTEDGECSTRKCTNGKCVFKSTGNSCYASNQCDGWVDGTHFCNPSTWKCAEVPSGDTCSIPGRPSVKYPYSSNADDDDEFAFDDINGVDDQDDANPPSDDFESYDDDAADGVGPSSCGFDRVCVPDFGSNAKSWPSSGVCRDLFKLADGVFSPAAQATAFIDRSDTIASTNPLDGWKSVYVAAEDCSSGVAKWNSDQDSFSCVSNSAYMNDLPSVGDECDASNFGKAQRILFLDGYDTKATVCKCGNQNMTVIANVGLEPSPTNMIGLYNDIKGVFADCQASSTCGQRAVAGKFAQFQCDAVKDALKSSLLFETASTTPQCVIDYFNNMATPYCDLSSTTNKNRFCDSNLDSRMGTCNYDTGSDGSPTLIASTSIALVLVLLFTLL